MQIFSKAKAKRKTEREASSVANSMSDKELIECARRAENGAKFTRLWTGDWSEDTSPSEADLALCSILAFWTRRDASRIEKLFRQSGLSRKKWERSGYRESTIGRACDLTKEVWTPRPLNGINRHKSLASPGKELPSINEQSRTARGIQRRPERITSGKSPSIFICPERVLSFVIRDEKCRQLIKEVSEAALRGRMTRSANFYRLSRAETELKCAPPLDAVRDILTLSAPDWPFPPLDGILEVRFSDLTEQS